MVKRGEVRRETADEPASLPEPAVPDAGTLAPRLPIRRFDVFAEYQRLKSGGKMSTDEAKGYALWLAKLVAARKFAHTTERRAALTEALHPPAGAEARPPGYRRLGGIEQTPELFDREIVQRMGPTFYEIVFSPAIAQAFANHESYESIRDRIRAPWNARRGKGAEAPE